MSAVAPLLAVLALVGTPWVVALGLLWRARPTRGSGAASDGPGRLLGLAVATLPEHRADWGRAMTAELAHLPNRSQRWWFALGGLRVALFPPRAGRRLMRATTAAAIVVAAGALVVVGLAPPGMEAFTATFAAVVGAVTTLAVARSGGLGLGRAGLALTTLVPAAVGGAIGTAVWFLRAHASADRASGQGSEALLAVVLSVVLCLVLAPPRALVSRRAVAALFGIGGGLGLGVSLGAGALLGDDSASQLDVMIFGPMLVAGVCGALAAAFGRSFLAGVQAAVWTVAVGAPVSLVVGIPAAVHAFQADRGLLLDGEVGLPIGTNLPDLTLYLAWILLAGLPYGIIGAAVGARLRPGPARDDLTVPGT
jgi:hypothetical protein